jgi:hypothetical protein
MSTPPQIKLLLIRDVFTATTARGKLYLNGAFQCYTLEDTDRKLELNPEGKIHGQTAIPRGLYKVILSESYRFKRILPEVLGVSGFRGIRIHPGNYAKDTEGCILVGRIPGVDYVGESKLAFDALFKQLSKLGAEITLEVQ